MHLQQPASWRVPLSAVVPMQMCLPACPPFCCAVQAPSAAGLQEPRYAVHEVMCCACCAVQGTLAQLDSKNPVMYLDFPQGRYKMFGAPAVCLPACLPVCIPHTHMDAVYERMHQCMQPAKRALQLCTAGRIGGC